MVGAHNFFGTEVEGINAMEIRGHILIALAGIVVLAAPLSLASPSSKKNHSAHPSSKSAKTAHPEASHPKVSHPEASHTKASHSKAHHAGKPAKKRARGQQAIDGERSRQIQEALMREHYMNGEPSGTWDEATQQAMRRYQADQGWQNKTVPDSRALIRLGLGPDRGHLLNPESAMISGPQVLRPTQAPVRAASSPEAPSVQSSVPASSTRGLPVRSSSQVSVPVSSLPDLSPSR